MEDSLFKNVRDALERNGISVTTKGLYRTANNGKQVPADAGMVFNTFGVQPQDFMDDFRRRTGSAINEVMDGEAPANAMNRYSEMLFTHPGITRLSPWAKPDNEMFSRFRFAVNELDGSMIIIVLTATGGCRPVPMSSNPAATARSLASVCSVLPAMDTEHYGNLYEELTVGYRAKMQSVVDRWRDREFLSQDDFVKHLGAHIPHSMLKNLSLKLMVEKVTKNVTVDGNSVTKEFMVPMSARLMQQFTEIEPIDFLVKFSDEVASRKEMKCPMPKVYTNDPTVPAFKYINLDSICKEGPCPTWDKYMLRYRTDEGEVVMAFIWGIVVADNNGRQILYIYDPFGYSGKGVLFAVIISFLGEELCASLQKDSLNNQFSLAKVWDKRLVTIGDNKNTKLIMSEKMHMMTGGDYADVEMKGMNSFHARLQTKVIASGNVPLEIHPDARHETSRVIMVTPHMTDEMMKEFCAVDENGNLKRRPNGDVVPLGDNTFERKLKDEFPMFLTKCREAYRRLCPGNADIYISDRMYEELLSHAPTETYSVADFFDACFEYDPESAIRVRDFAKEFLRALDGYSGFTRRGENPITMEVFKEYVTKKYPAVRFGKAVRSGGSVIKCVVGIRRKDPDAKAKEQSTDQWEGIA